MRVIGEQRVGEINLNTGSNGQTVVEETYHYIVEADSNNDSRLAVSLCPGLPQVGITYSSGGIALCKSITGSRRQENPKIWDFTCNFSSEVDQNNQNPTNTDPETWIPIRRTMFEKFETQEFKDINGKVFANSARQPFADGITRVRYIIAWEFDQFESATVTDQDIAERTEIINSSTYLGYPPKTLLLRVMDSVVGFYYGKRRRLTKYRMMYRPDDWDLMVLDKGDYYRDANDKKVPFPDGVGRGDFVGFLDGKGKELTFADPNDPQPNEFKYRLFQVYPDYGFANFLRF
jgi:hypothetical protein